MEKVRRLRIESIVVPVLMVIVSLTFPFWIYGANDRFESSSVLFYISTSLSDPGTSVRFIPDISLLVPSLLICIPCFLWLWKERDMRLPVLLGSSGIVILAISLILLLFLPWWAVFPWFGGAVIAIVPRFIDLIPFSGLAFTVMVLLPLLWRVIMYPSFGDIALGKRVTAAVLSVSTLVLPVTIETFSWQGSDFNRSFFEGFALNSVTWFLSNRIDGNRWGQGTWFRFSTSSIFASLSILLQILPGIIFAWLICRDSFRRERITQMFAFGAAHLFIVSAVCIWLNYTESHAGVWIITPFPALLIVGLVIVIAYYGYSRRETGKSSETNTVNGEEQLSHVMV